ncbi:MAG: helix-turn-helix domain-containing protein [Streptomycetaceae bacterium]|nr:helix-turn-helix domain-containing protein [Streptomycetaceae bacterium]
METAARVLADSRQRHRSIAAVARSVGIESPTTFARMFRARYGLSPRDFRHAPFGSAAGDAPGTEGRELPRGS